MIVVEVRLLLTGHVVRLRLVLAVHVVGVELVLTVHVLGVRLVLAVFVVAVEMVLPGRAGGGEVWGVDLASDGGVACVDWAYCRFEVDVEW